MILYSRFNCRQYVIESLHTEGLSGIDMRRAARRMVKFRFDEMWLKRRIQLFEAFTYPSVLSQTHQDFRWLVLVHPNSPSWVIDRMKSYSRLETCLVEWDVEAAIRGVKSVNLDTDDAIARNFMKVANEVNFEGETILYRGMRHRILTGVWIGARSPNAHFGIIQHPVDTVLDHSHGMGILPKDVLDLKAPMWLEVIHEENISNKLVKARASKDVKYETAAKYFDVRKDKIDRLCTPLLMQV
jgi:hypothetical protein